MKQALIVVGLGYGDEGKGTTVDALTHKYNAGLVVRFNGGGQAAHNVIAPDGIHHTFSQFGSGSFHGAKTLLSRHAVIYPQSLFNEAKALSKKLGQDVLQLLHIESGAKVTTPYLVLLNRFREVSRRNGKHGSCGMGIGETENLHLKHPDRTLLVKDIQTSASGVRKILEEQRAYVLEELNTNILPGFPKPSEVERTLKEYLDYGFAALKDSFFLDTILKTYEALLASGAHICDSTWLHDELDKDQTVIFEGAQGVLLDQDHGFHPYTTWSNTTFENAEDLIDRSRYTGNVKRIGVTRAYMTRHGAGPFVSEAPECKFLSEYDHNITNTWQDGFRSGYFDVVATQYAIDVVGGVDSLVVTHVDRMFESGLGSFVDIYLPQYGHSADENMFEVDSNGWISGIRVNRPADLERQAVLTSALFGLTAGHFEVGEDEDEDWGFTIARRLNVPLLCYSTGPTLGDKVWAEESDDA